MKSVHFFTTKGLLLDTTLTRNLKLIANDYDITMNTLVQILMEYMDNGYFPDEKKPPCSREICNSRYRIQKNYKVDSNVYTHLKRQAIEKCMTVNDLINWCFNCIVDDEPLDELIFNYLKREVE